MKYGCLIYVDEARLDALTDEEWASLRTASREFEEELRRGGNLVACETLGPARTATTVRLRGGRLVTADGSVAGGGEQLGGLLILEARDLNEALRLASGAPTGRFGGVEVRPVLSLTR